MTEQVFAYGSNMCSGRFRDYGVRPIGAPFVAVLRDYCLAFNKKSRKDGSGKATVEPDPGSEVWGVVFSIATADLNILDSGEGPGYQRGRLPAISQTELQPKLGCIWPGRPMTM